MLESDGALHQKSKIKALKGLDFSLSHRLKAEERTSFKGEQQAENFLLASMSSERDLTPVYFSTG